MSSWRTALVLAVSVLSVPAAALVAFVAWITGSDCFVECVPGSGDPSGAVLLAVLAVLLLLSGPVAGWVLLRLRGAGLAAVGLLLGVAATVVTTGAF